MRSLVPSTTTRRLSAVAALVVIALLSVAARSPEPRRHLTGAEPRRHLAGAPAFVNHVLVNGATIMHSTPSGPAPVSGPDDITRLNDRIFVAFQNGVGSQGEPSSTGVQDSTVVELTPAGDVLAKWNIKGKCDGLTADPELGEVIATVNEDGNSSLYLIAPGPGTHPAHYVYNRPLPSNGGTDAITVHDGMVLISASAPGTIGAPAPQPTYPAVYVVRFSTATRVAHIEPLFYDEATATVANINGALGTTVSLALVDPDSNANVPSYALRFGGDFELTSQGDKEQIYVDDPGTPRQALKVLTLSDSVDDTVWASGSSGSIYVTDGDHNTVNVITGQFGRGHAYVADTPCDAGNAPSTCPGPGFPSNFFGELNTNTGKITRLALSGPELHPKGMMFVP